MSQIQNRSAVSLLGAPQSPLNIGSMTSPENAVETVISTQSVFVDLNLNDSAVPGSNINLWSVSDADTGELTYNGLSPFMGSIIAVLAIVSAGAADEFHFRAVKNGSPLVDNILSGHEISNTLGSLTLLAPISVVTGDTIRIQVENADGTSNIVIHQMTAQIS